MVRTILDPLGTNVIKYQLKGAQILFFEECHLSLTTQSKILFKNAHKPPPTSPRQFKLVHFCYPHGIYDLGLL